MILGEVVEGWLVVSLDLSGRVTLAKIPIGDDEYGLGRTWHAKDVERRVVEPTPEGLN